MAIELVTPTDEMSGLPLAIAPKCEWLPMHNAQIADEHHGWHRKSAPLLNTLAGLALRNSWLQLIERDLHNEGPFRYHKHFSGPSLSIDEVDIFSRITLACAGFIPDHVIDTQKGDSGLSFVRPITKKEAEFLRTPSENNIFTYRYIQYRYEPIKEFFQGYTLNHVSHEEVDEFLHTKNLERKKEIGRLLLQNAVELVTDDIKAKYLLTKKQGLLHPAMPANPEELVLHKLGTQNERDHLVSKLQDKIAA